MAVEMLYLKNGDTILCDVVNDSIDSLQIKNPVKPLPTPQGVGLIPFIIGLKKDSEINIPASEIVVRIGASEIEEQMYNEYSKVFGSGLTVASTSTLKNVESQIGKKIHPLKK